MLPKFESITRNGNSVTLNLRGTPGAPYTIQTSTNLAAWIDVTTFTANAATGAGTVIHSTTAAARYYRAVSKP